MRSLKIIQNVDQFVRISGSLYRITRGKLFSSIKNRRLIMSTKILRLDTSLFSEQGSSSRLNQALIEKLGRVYGDLEIVHRDLARDPLPHFSAEVIGALSARPEERTPEQAGLARLADNLVAELQSADIIVVAAPMYNFGIPSTLKAWIDFVARAGVTFRYTDKGPEGLVKGKTVYVVTTRGGVHRDQQTDTEVPHLHIYFHFLGITDIRTLYAEGLNMDQRDRQFAEALANIDVLVAA
jgi:FMN-dependent NADH-azoreductase